MTAWPLCRTAAAPSHTAPSFSTATRKWCCCFCLVDQSLLCCCPVSSFSYVRPKALLAVAAMLLTLAANLATLSAPPSSWEASLAPLVSVLVVCTFLLASWTRCISLLLRWLLYCTSLSGLHACLRRAQSEHRAGLASKRSGNPLGLLRRRQPLAAVQGDRWQLFREIWAVLRNQGQQAALSGWASLQYYWYTAWDSMWPYSRRIRARAW